MAVKIRLTRTGQRNKPYWRIGVFDTRTRRDGRSLEILGTYDPYQKKAEDKVKIDQDRYAHWIGNGALPSESLNRLLTHTGHLKK